MYSIPCIANFFDPAIFPQKNKIVGGQSQGNTWGVFARN